MRRLNIGFFTNTYHPNINGVVRSVDSFRNSLTELGHNVFIFAQGGINSNYKDVIPFVFRYPAIKPLRKIDYSLAFPKSHFISKLIPTLKMDIIHSHHPVLLGRVAAQKAKKLDIPLVATFHTQYSEFTHYIPFYQPLVKRAVNIYIDNYWRQCQHIIVPSDSMRQELERKGIKGKITTLPTIIETDLFQNVDGSRVREDRGWGNQTVIISVGRMAKEKNFKLLIRAAKEVFDRFENVKLVLVGDGDYRKSLEKYCEKLKINDRVEFVGKVHFKDIPYYLKAADLFCFASTTETQGIVTMEAIAAGLPVVAVDAIGTKDVVINQKNGLLVDKNYHKFAEAVCTILENKEFYSNLKKGVKESIRKYDSETQAQKLIEIYEEAIIDKKRGYHIEV